MRPALRSAPTTYLCVCVCVCVIGRMLIGVGVLP